MYSKKVFSLVMIAAATSMCACTDEEIADTVGTIAIVGGAIAIGTTTHCEAGETQVCHDFSDYWGNIQTECHEEYDSCAFLAPNARRINAVAAASPSAKTPDLTLVDADHWGDTFNMSFASSATFIAAMQAAKKGDLTAVKSLGLSDDEIKTMAEGKLPSAAGIDAVAKTLDQSADTVAKMLATLQTSASQAARE